MNLNIYKLKEIVRNWKETRKFYSRRAILFYYSKWKLKLLKWYCYRLWYKLTKYEHTHILYSLFECSICRKSKIDIDYERLNKGKENEI